VHSSKTPELSVPGPGSQGSIRDQMEDATLRRSQEHNVDQIDRALNLWENDSVVGPQLEGSGRQQALRSEEGEEVMTEEEIRDRERRTGVTRAFWPENFFS